MYHSLARRTITDTLGDPQWTVVCSFERAQVGYEGRHSYVGLLDSGVAILLRNRPRLCVVCAHHARFNNKLRDDHSPCGFGYYIARNCRCNKELSSCHNTGIAYVYPYCCDDPVPCRACLR